MEVEKAAKKLSEDSSLRKAAETLAKKQQQQQNGSENSDDDDDDDDECSSQNKAALKKAAAELDAIKELQQKAERRKTFLMQLIAAHIGAAGRLKWVQCFLCISLLSLV